jgi:hypothetical protein
LVPLLLPVVVVVIAPESAGTDAALSAVSSSVPTRGLLQAAPRWWLL